MPIEIGYRMKEETSSTSVILIIFLLNYPTSKNQVLIYCPYVNEYENTREFNNGFKILTEYNFRLNYDM